MTNGEPVPAQTQAFQAIEEVLQQFMTEHESEVVAALEDYVNGNYARALIRMNRIIKAGQEEDPYEQTIRLIKEAVIDNHVLRSLTITVQPSDIPSATEHILGALEQAILDVMS